MGRFKQSDCALHFVHAASCLQGHYSKPRFTPSHLHEQVKVTALVPQGQAQILHHLQHLQALC
jgi:hypothetical protein